MASRTPSPRGKGRETPGSAILNARAAAEHPLEWVFEPLREHPGFLRRKIFGCEAAYVGGRLQLVVAAGEEPWNGLLVATGREFHEALCREWKPLRSHPVLGKWLYLSQDDPRFEEIATALAKSVRDGDPRIGVDPRPRKRRKNPRAQKPDDDAFPRRK